MRSLLLAPILVLAACADNASPTPEPTTLTCVEIRDALEDLIATTSRACTTRSDCVAVGYALDTFGGPTCNVGIPFTFPCYGTPVNGASWSAHPTTSGLLGAWVGRCAPLGDSSGVQAWYDCGVGTVDCVDDVCTIMAFNCFDPFPDAGVD